MKNLTFLVVSAILVSVLGVSHSGVINEPLDDAEPYSLIDDIIKGLLEKMRSSLADLKFENINETVNSPDLNASILIKDISIANADKFAIKELHTDLIPLRMKNLTLTWDQIIANANYDIKFALNAPPTKGPFNLFAKGEAKAILNSLYFTVGANVELKNSAIQIKPKGLFGFDLLIGKSNVTLTSLMGSTDLGKAVGMLISEFIPEAVNALKKPAFVVFQDDIIRIVNEILKKKVMLMDEEQMPQLESSESFLKNWNLNDDADSSLKQVFDLEMNQLENEY